MDLYLPDPLGEVVVVEGGVGDPLERAYEVGGLVPA